MPLSTTADGVSDDRDFISLASEQADKAEPAEGFPTLALNARFVETLAATDSPCAALGFIESNGRRYGLIAMSPATDIAPIDGSAGVQLEFASCGTRNYEVLRTSITFVGHAQYHVLINPASPVTRTVMTRLSNSRSIYFLLHGRSGDVQVYRTPLGKGHSRWLQLRLPDLLACETSSAEYWRSLAKFRRREDAQGELLNWICRDDVACLDLSGEKVEVQATSQPRDIEAVAMQDADEVCEVA